MSARAAQSTTPWRRQNQAPSAPRLRMIRWPAGFGSAAIPLPRSDLVTCTLSYGEDVLTAMAIPDWNQGKKPVSVFDNRDGKFAQEIHELGRQEDTCLAFDDDRQAFGPVFQHLTRDQRLGSGFFDPQRPNHHQEVEDFTECTVVVFDRKMDTACLQDPLDI